MSELVKRLGYHRENEHGKLVLANPDGPEAADRITALEAENKALRDVMNSSVATISALYQHLERVELAGGATSISGIAACNTMLKSMRKNAGRLEELIIKPSRDLLAKEAGK